ncbi:hypothetical protein LSAT2_028146 [Lamellibrachia satsuma]|nr:hypothetical protein LSAT2_028146 [Lamellibrachia satsuma]
MYKTECARVKSIIKEAKSVYYASEIEQCGNDNRRLYHLLNGLLQRRKSPCLPANDNMHMHDLAASFSNFFCAKIDTIRVALRTQSTLTSTTLTDQHPTPCGSQLHSFPAATTSDIRNLLNKSPTISPPQPDMPASRFRGPVVVMGIGGCFAVVGGVPVAVTLGLGMKTSATIIGVGFMGFGFTLILPGCVWCCFQQGRLCRDVWRRQRLDAPSEEMSALGDGDGNKYGGTEHCVESAQLDLKDY